VRVPYSVLLLTLALGPAAACSRNTPPSNSPSAPGSMPVQAPQTPDAAPGDDTPADSDADSAPAADTDADAADPSSGDAPVIVPGGSVGSGPSKDAAALYAQCEDRLEQPESEGECSSDADCAPAGCSGERCITKAAAKDLMGTCEMLPCFQVVDTCGCVEGRCRWSLKP